MTAVPDQFVEDLRSLNVHDLRLEAQRMHLVGVSKLRREDLIQKIALHRATPGVSPPRYGDASDLPWDTPLPGSSPPLGRSVEPPSPLKFLTRGPSFRAPLPRRVSPYLGIGSSLRGDVSRSPTPPAGRACLPSTMSDQEELILLVGHRTSVDTVGRGSMSPGRLLLVDGMAGSGKTSAVWTAARRYPDLRFVLVTSRSASYATHRASPNVKVVTSPQLEDTSTDSVDVVAYDQAHALTPTNLHLLDLFLKRCPPHATLVLLGDRFQGETYETDARFLTLADALWQSRRPDCIRVTLKESWRLNASTAWFINQCVGSPRLRGLHPENHPVLYLTPAHGLDTAPVETALRHAMEDGGLTGGDVLIVAPHLDAPDMVALRGSLPCGQGFTFASYGTGLVRLLVVVLGFNTSAQRYVPGRTHSDVMDTVTYTTLTRASRQLIVVAPRDAPGHPFVQNALRLSLTQPEARQHLILHGGLPPMVSPRPWSPVLDVAVESLVNSLPPRLRSTLEELIRPQLVSYPMDDIVSSERMSLEVRCLHPSRGEIRLKVPADTVTLSTQERIVGLLHGDPLTLAFIGWAIQQGFGRQPTQEGMPRCALLNPAARTMMVLTPPFDTPAFAVIKARYDLTVSLDDETFVAHFRLT